MSTTMIAQVEVLSEADLWAWLAAQGRMQPPGLAAVKEGRAGGRWEISDQVDNLDVPDDLRAALDQRQAAPWFNVAAPSYHHNVLRFMASAKRPETRPRRVAIIADHAARGEKVPQY